MSTTGLKLKARRIDITGQIFGRLTVVSFADVNIHGHARWNCVCECGGVATASRLNLMNGHVQSCKCLMKELASERQRGIAKKHGHAVDDHLSPTYKSWRSMIKRCTNPKVHGWEHYGGATPPVIVCDRWLKFENFLADMGERPDGTTLSRVGDAGNYEYGKVVWGTTPHQFRQRRVKRARKIVALALRGARAVDGKK